MKDLFSKVMPVMSLLAMVVSFASCSDDDNKEGDTYFLSNEGKVWIDMLSDQASVSFYSEDEASLRSELGKYGLTLTDVMPYGYEEEDCTAEGWALMENLMHGTVKGGNYQKAESAHRYIVGGFPCCRLVEDGCLLAPRILIYVRIEDGVEYEELERFAERNGIVIVAKDSADIYILACTSDSKGDVIKMSNRLYTSGLVKWSEIIGTGHGHLCQAN